MIIKEDREGILILKLDRQKALNALNQEILDELQDIFVDNASETMGKYYGVVLTGNGEKAFAAGADIKEFPNYEVAEGKSLSRKGHKIFDAIEGFQIPVAAVANGYALGGGCELYMACHLLIAEEHAKFGQPEINLGLVPGYGGSQRLVRLLGRPKAIELLLTGDMISAEQALKLGMLNYVTPMGEGLDKALKMMEKIKAKSPETVSRMLKLIHHYQKFENNFELESEIFGECFGLADMREGVKAFLEKRPASFSRK